MLHQGRIFINAHFANCEKEKKIRGATLIYGKKPHTQQDTNISPATNVCHHVMEYSVSNNRKPLTMPSATHCGSLHFDPALSFPGFSVRASTAFTFASTVYVLTVSDIF